MDILELALQYGTPLALRTPDLVVGGCGIGG
jgi:hypothetical protein